MLLAVASDCLIMTAVDSDVAGPLVAQVTQDVFDRDQRRVVIPRGSRLLGAYDSQREPAAGHGHQDDDRGAGDGAVEAGAVRGPAGVRQHGEERLPGRGPDRGRAAGSVYLTVAPSDLDRMRPLLRILLNQITRQLTREVRPGRRPVLLMLDEFTALGPSESVDQANRGWARYEEPQASGDSRSASRVLGATASGGAEGLANGHGEPPRGREFSVHCSAFVVQSSNAISCLSP